MGRRGRPAARAAAAPEPGASAGDAAEVAQPRAAPDSDLSSGSAARLLVVGDGPPFAEPLGTTGSAPAAAAASAPPAMKLEAEAAAFRTALGSAVASANPSAAEADAETDEGLPAAEVPAVGVKAELGQPLTPAPRVRRHWRTC